MNSYSAGASFGTILSTISWIFRCSACCCCWRSVAAGAMPRPLPIFSWGSSTTHEMNGVLGHNSALEGYTRQGTTWDNEMNFGMNHAPGVGLIARPVDKKSNALPLSYRRLFVHNVTYVHILGRSQFGCR